VGQYNDQVHRNGISVELRTDYHTMYTITVETEAASLVRSENESITGVIYFDFDSYQFPEKGWNDFIVVVLCWWLSSLKNIISCWSDSEELRFMDGSLYICVKKLSYRTCKVECFDENADGVAEFSGEYQIADVLSSVLDAARSTSSICSRNNWNNKNIDELDELIEEVSK